MIILPTQRFSEDAYHEYDVTFETVRLILTFTWYERIESWYMDILDSDLNRITVGIRVVVGIPLDLHRKSAALPPNMFILALDLDGTDLDPFKRTDLGTRISIMLIERSAIVLPVDPNPITITVP